LDEWSAATEPIDPKIIGAVIIFLLVFALIGLVDRSLRLI